MNNIIRVGFLGSGGIAQSHAFALENLKYYYPDAPMIEKAFVASPTPANRNQFASRFGFKEAISPEAVWDRTDFDTLYILGLNQTHTPQLIKAMQLPNIERIFVEKPLGTTRQDIQSLEHLEQSNHGKKVITGFQYLQKSALRKALTHWHSGIFGEPISFRSEYLHSSYLDPSYRQKNQARLLPTPINGAAADLGSHILSLLIAFLGNGLVIKSAAASGRFTDVPPSSDLCTTALIEETHSGAIGTLVASRVSQGTGDYLSLEIRGTLGALLYNTTKPDEYETYLPEFGWQRYEVMSDYLPASKFPMDYAPSGWLRALIHQHYVFLTESQEVGFFPGLHHGIQVQHLLQQIADQITC